MGSSEQRVFDMLWYCFHPTLKLYKRHKTTAIYTIDL